MALADADDGEEGDHSGQLALAGGGGRQGLCDSRWVACTFWYGGVSLYEACELLHGDGGVSESQLLAWVTRGGGGLVLQEGAGTRHDGGGEVVVAANTRGGDD